MNIEQLIVSKGFYNTLIPKFKLESIAFLNSCRTDEGKYRLTPNSEATPFALCFAIFLLELLGRLNDIKPEFPLLTEELVKGIRDYKEQRKKIATLHTDKAFLQLLAFSLSALYLLDELHNHPLDDIVEPLIPKDMIGYLTDIGSFDGVPQSGNLAMCMAVLSIYSRDYLGMPTNIHINEWVESHLKHMNKYGFWGEDKISHLQFQNGYHQYEILEYLEVKNHKISNAVNTIRKIADYRGQFAPYFGGGGCYDYDAVSILTSSQSYLDGKNIKLFKLISETIMSEQNKDGGFSDSQWIRPRTLNGLIEWGRHIYSGEGDLRIERLRYFIALQFPKNNYYHTHWTKYSRRWDESNLWDTWFRMLTIARIDVALDPNQINKWGFINYPGIGFHYLVN